MEASGDPGPVSAHTRALRLSDTPRVSQVDAEYLDEALVSMLGERVERSLGVFRASFSMDLKPEIGLLLKLIIFRYGVWDPFTRSSPGAKLQNLKLASSVHGNPTRRTLLLYLLLHPPIFPSYILNRLRTYALSNQWPDLPAKDPRKQAWKAIIWTENISRVWELTGWVSFLFDGRYPSLLMRILKLRLVPSSLHLTKLVSYEFMNRQLVWSAFTEFLMFAVPLLPAAPTFLRPQTLIQPIKSLLTKPTPIDYNLIPAIPLSTTTDASGKPNRAAHSGPQAKLPLSICPICHMRNSSAPVPLSDTSAGQAINLPPIGDMAANGNKLGDDSLEDDTAGLDEERIFVPAQTDCWGGCRYCYYCVAGELAKHHEVVAKAQRAYGKEKGESMDEEKERQKWDCLRCGGGVTRAWRVGGDPAPVPAEVESAPAPSDTETDSSEWDKVERVDI